MSEQPRDEYRVWNEHQDYELWGLCQMKVVEQTNSFVLLRTACN